MEANELPERIEPADEYLDVGTRFLDNDWGSEAQWNQYEQVTSVVYHHDNAHGERVFSVIGEDVPGCFTWVCESDVMFVNGAEQEERLVA